MLSCNTNPQQKEPFRSMLLGCTEVDMAFYNNGDTLHFKTTDSSGIKLLREMITGDNEVLPDTCAPVGVLNFNNQSQSLLPVQFAIKKIADKIGCNYITYTYSGVNYKHKLSEKGKDLLLQLEPR
jgi:hypothetical protein